MSLGVDASTITHRVQALEQSGYVERLADPAWRHDVLLRVVWRGL